jgi:hypothetical protein
MESVKLVLGIAYHCHEVFRQEGSQYTIRTSDLLRDVEAP